MFLGGLKAKSVLRKIKQIAGNRAYKGSKKPIEHVAIIQSVNCAMQEHEIASLAQSLEIPRDKITVLTYVKKVAKEDKDNEQVFGEAQIGWNGSPKNQVLKSFTQTPFDILISSYGDEDIVAYALTAQSNARFKVGVSNAIEGINDLVIYKKDDQAFQIFIAELIKYLHILKIAS